MSPREFQFAPLEHLIRPVLHSGDLVECGDVSLSRSPRQLAVKSPPFSPVPVTDLEEGRYAVTKIFKFFSPTIQSL